LKKPDNILLSGFLLFASEGSFLLL